MTSLTRDTLSSHGNIITLHKPADFKSMEIAGRLASQTLDYIEPFIQPGVSTGYLDRLCHDFIVDHGAIPAPLNYNGFPKSICTSVNHVVCHGIPSDTKILALGDILNIDVTVIVDGWHGDTNRTFPVGKIGVLAQKLINVTYDATMRAIDIVRPGTTLGDIGYVLENHAKANRFSVVRDFCGHGIGRVFHADPNVLNFGDRGDGLVIEEGMFFTIEPMINAGKGGVKTLQDGWTAVTRDHSLSAQFEHTIGVTATGHQIFTLSA